MFFDYTILVIVITSIALSLLYSLITGISPVSSTFQSRKKIVKAISPKQKGFIYELGADWGALAFPLARRCPESKVVAYELSPVPWIFLKLRAFFFGPRNLKIVRRNFLKEDMSKASLIVCYLYPGAMAKLSSKLVMELNPSAKVISNTFEIPNWTPTAIQSLEDVMCPQVFYYEMGSVMAGIQQSNEIFTTMIV